MSHVEDTPGYDGPPLKFEYDGDRDRLTVEGIAYSGEIFRQWSKRGMPTGALFEFVRSDSGGFSLRQIWPKKVTA